MSIYTRFVIILISFGLSFSVKAQNTLPEANALLDAEQMQFQSFLNGLNGDTAINLLMDAFVSSTADSLQIAINDDRSIVAEKKLKGITSIRYFLQIIRAGITQKQFELYDIPDALDKFPKIADALVHGTAFRPFLLGFGARRTQIMADTFRQFPEGKRFQHLADVRRISMNMEMILPMVEARPDFPYVDTVLVYVAERDPMEIVDYITLKNNRITDSIYKLKHPLLEQLITLKGNRNASEIAPLVGEIAAGRLTADSIQNLRSNNVTGYYQLLVNTLQQNRTSIGKGAAAGMQPALRNALHDKAMAFYIKPINELHEKKDDIRFKSIQPLRAIDLYYLVTSGEDELYTSSFLGIYKKLMEQLPAGRSDSLMEWVQYDQFRKFIRISSHYNVLNDFLNNMPEDSRQQLLSRFIGGIDSSPESGIEDAMDVADAFSSLSKDSTYSPLVASLLKENITRCARENNRYCVRLYSILQQVFTMASDPASSKDIFSKLGNYELLKMDALRDKQNIINQLVIFYGDDDGKASFNSFMQIFKDTAAWKVTESEQWVEISSRQEGQQVKLFANLPLDNDKGLDEQAQLALMTHLKAEKINPGVIIHRGHSYHLPTTLNYLQPSMKLAFLGSCGGFRNILTVAGKSPDAQILATRQIGSKLINDPMIQEMNLHFLESRDINWPQLWTQLGEQFSKTDFTKNLFEEYVPPYRNLSLFVIRLYNIDASSL